MNQGRNVNDDTSVSNLSAVGQLAHLLNITEITDSTLQLCIKLLDQGVDPQALANYIIKINNETRMALS